MIANKKRSANSITYTPIRMIGGQMLDFKEKSANLGAVQWAKKLELRYQPQMTGKPVYIQRVARIPLVC